MAGYPTTQQLRDMFTGYFRDRGHLLMPSAPLVLNDPTTLFTSAGMQPYIAAFRGEEEPPAPRVVSIQKCARTGDLEHVGYYNRYHTFFEMLGNFSFGDYFKKEAIEWAWEFVTAPAFLGLDPADLWITIFETDDEAFDLWHSHIGVPAERIQRFGRKENWWPQTRWEGPCGPCSEIHIDLGPHLGCGKPDCRVNCDCQRYLELWNLVFQMYTEAEDGTLTPLPSPGVDTGMGLERLALVKQNKRFTMETDELWRILQATQSEVNAQRSQPLAYGDDEEADAALRVVAEHVRAAAFMMADGAVPSNEGAGYVLRRLLRRALRFARSLEAEQPFLYRVLPTVTEVMGQAYPELADREEFAVALTRSEEERFTATLSQGMARFEEIAEHLVGRGDTVVPGRDAFVLYDTYGFPLELTIEMAAERGLQVDRDGFEAAMADQRARSSTGPRGLALHTNATIAASLPRTDFLGYGALEGEGEVLAIVRAGERINMAECGEEVTVVLDRTPFYAESGGQVGDRGEIEGPEGSFEVTDTQPLGEAHAHVGKVVHGRISVGQKVLARVDAERRRATMRHHTATHLLQAALRQVLGNHAAQSGSYVGPDRLRFDFTHHKPLSEEQTLQVEDLVNRWVLANLPVCTEELPIQEAIQRGAIALFGEKYGDTVRLLEVRDVSKELCGGTHVSHTGEIGAFRIVSQESVAAGVRRIEAMAGLAAIEYGRQRERILAELSRELRAAPDELVERVAALQARIRQLQEEVRQAQQMRATASVDDLLAKGKDVGGVTLVAEVVPGVDREMLSQLADELAARLPNGAVLLGTETDGKVALVAKIADSVVQRGGHAGELVRQVAAACGGSGGGRPHFAQAGAREPEKLPEALAVAVDVLARQLGIR